MGQCEAILKHLQSGNTITPAQAYEMCGSLALHSRISELRERGHQIACDMVTVPSGKSVGQYRLLNAAQAAG